MKRRATSRGFTYLGLLILLAVMGMVAAAGLKMGTLLQRAAAEEELLEIGAQFSEALRSYAAATPQGKPQQPPSLQELLKDPRFPNPRRHLRKIFVDPVTGKAEWGIVYLGDKVGVIGVHSLSTAKPLKVANFDIRFQNMENRKLISDWKFGMAGGQGVQPALVTPPNSMTGAAPGAAPSLFAPAASGESAGTKGGKPVEAAGGKPMEPPAPAPAPEPEMEHPTAEPEPEPPMQAQSDDEKAAEAARQKEEAEAEAEEKEREKEKEQEKEKENEKEGNSTSGTTKPAAGPLPAPDNRARRR